MARLPRLTVPGLPHHVIWRGNNRQTVFVDHQDRQFFLDQLAQWAGTQAVLIHAYVLMDNHVHLLVTPKTADALPKFMQSVGRSYVRYFNRRHGRSGTLWEGRYRSTVIQAERHLLACMAYMDLNPVRAGLVHAPDQYAWSSHAHFIGSRIDKFITPHPLVWALGNTPFAREAAYREWVAAGVSSLEQEALTQSALTGWVLGDAGFMAQLAEQTSRRLTKKQPGRPPLTTK